MKAALLNRLASDVAAFEIDRESVPQGKLDLENRVRTSVFPWRGQFSPGLIDLILSLHTRPGAVVVDPFVGSGTTLFESTRRGLECYGSEINPAAAQLASIATLSRITKANRKKLIKKLDSVVDENLGEFLPRSLFRQGSDSKNQSGFAVEMSAQLRRFKRETPEYIILAATLLMAMGDEADLDGESFEKSYSRVKATVEALPESNSVCEVFLTDARNLPIDTDSTDLVITSPPYINVFNYHQNYRKAVELLGWDVLGFAKSEIGANRKHRQNRFLTVTQYCMDMLGVLCEMRRMLKSKGRAVITIGRESKVRGISFANGQLLAMLATDGAGFEVETWRERKFTNRFGTAIYEDILTLKPRKTRAEGVEFARSVGTWALSEALKTATDPDVISDLEKAIAGASEIKESPLHCIEEVKLFD